ncbi:hypothetical protein Q1695_013500 [Nippostrongylus brasiliensis]|nr:hypothetical protein Q1695_013500 [Nippostrongylus brasiliensis]
MKTLLFTIGLLAVSTLAFAEEETQQISKSGLEVLDKLRALRKEEDDALEAIEDLKEKDLIHKILDKEEAEADKLEESEDESTRVKRAARRRRPARRALSRRRAAARRRHARRHRRNQRRAARRRVNHTRRHRRNQRRAARRRVNLVRRHRRNHRRVVQRHRRNQRRAAKRARQLRG